MSRRPESDLADLATSPEAALAAALLGAATAPFRRRDGGCLDFWGCGHGLGGAPAPGLDHDAVGAVGREDRMGRWRQSDGQQARALRAVARWRANGGTPDAEPVWTRSLAPTLRAYVNACNDWDLTRLDDDARPGAELSARLREYRQRGAELAQAHPDLGDVQAGPPPRDGLVGLPSWRQDAPADDTPAVPAPPAPPGGPKL